MKPLFRFLPMLAFLTVLALCWRPAQGVTPQSTPSLSVPQVLQAATAKAVPMLQGLCFYTVQNGGAASVFLGTDALVDDGVETVDKWDGGQLDGGPDAGGYYPDAGPAPSHRGVEIKPGGSYSLTVTYQLAYSATSIWLFSRAGDTAGDVTVQGAC